MEPQLCSYKDATSVRLQGKTIINSKQHASPLRCSQVNMLPALGSAASYLPLAVRTWHTCSRVTHIYCDIWICLQLNSTGVFYELLLGLTTNYWPLKPWTSGNKCLRMFPLFQKQCPTPAKTICASHNYCDALFVYDHILLHRKPSMCVLWIIAIGL